MLHNGHGRIQLLISFISCKFLLFRCDVGSFLLQWNTML